MAKSGFYWPPASPEEPGGFFTNSLIRTIERPEECETWQQFLAAVGVETNTYYKEMKAKYKQTTNAFKGQDDHLPFVFRQDVSFAPMPRLASRQGEMVENSTGMNVTPIRLRQRLYDDETFASRSIAISADGALAAVEELDHPDDRSM
jgi:hypothetical protein